MCDTYVVLPDISATNSVVLCKNSDRPSFDCQPLAFHQKKTFKKGEKLQLAYCTIDQVEERFASVGSSPYWCWGYEEGLNEYGVAIGNEAIYTKALVENTEAEKNGNPVKKGIIGMELLRLGLERGKTAKEALDVMTALIEQYGLWGTGVPMADTVAGSYDNAFVIADKKEAYLLQTAGDRYAAKRIEKGFEACSNEASIRKEITYMSKDLIDNAVEKGWWPEEKSEEFDFAAYIDPVRPRQVSHIRVQRMRQLLKQAVSEQGKVNIPWMKRILRDHYEDTFLEGPYFNPSAPDFLTICMHHSLAGFTWGNTASSSLFILPQEEDKLSVMWWAPVVPCCSVYIPVFVESLGLPENLQKAGTYGKCMCAPCDVTCEDTYREGSFWWEMRSLLEAVNGDEFGSSYNERHESVRERFDVLEEKWMFEINEVEAEAIALRTAGKTDEMARVLYAFTERCMNEALDTIKELKNQW